MSPLGHWKLLFPSEYVGAWDLGGEDRVVTITHIEMEDLVTMSGKKRKTEAKPTLTFDGKQKRLVLNKTNAKTIAKMYGDDTKKWIGKKITIYATTCEAFGETVECIRIRSDKPRGNGRRKDPDPPRDEHGNGAVDEADEPTDEQLSLNNNQDGRDE